jgi:phospholipase C
MRVNRRQVLAGLGASLGAAAVGCGSDASGGDDDGDDDTAAPPDGAPPRIDAMEPDAAVDACTATSDLTAAQLLAGVETIVVLCMENRSFDHYLGSLRLLEGRGDIDGLTGAEWNPDPDGNPVQVHQLDDFTPADPPHGWDAVHEQWNDGANDGFVRAHAGDSQADVMGYHTRAQLPVTYALADAGAICQRWFCGVLGPTWPNRFYLHAASSRGQKSNLPVFGLTTIWDRLADAGLEGTNYYHDVAWATGGFGKLSGLASISRFFEDAMAGNLPPFALLDPAFFGGGANDDHPDHDVRLGQALIGSVVSALAQSPQWNKCLFVLTYDEHGGFYDHVPPPATVDSNAEFQQLGFRVPSIVIGPTVRRGCAIDDVLEHSSVPATVTRRHGLPVLNARAGQVKDLSVCIDPARIGNPLPPPVVPAMTVSRSAVAAQQERYRRRGQVSHPELMAAIDAMNLPRGIDRRAETDAIANRVLAWGERLGAVKLVD